MSLKINSSVKTEPCRTYLATNHGPTTTRTTSTPETSDARGISLHRCVAASHTPQPRAGAPHPRGPFRNRRDRRDEPRGKIEDALRASFAMNDRDDRREAAGPHDGLHPRLELLRGELRRAR